MSLQLFSVRTGRVPRGAMLALAAVGIALASADVSQAFWFRRGRVDYGCCASSCNCGCATSCSACGSQSGLGYNEGPAPQQRSYSYVPAPERTARREVRVIPAETGPSDADVREK